MRIDSLEADKCLRGSPLGFHLRTFASSLVEEGYTDRTIQLKLGLLACLGRWLQPTKLAVTDLDERVLEAFLKYRRRVHGGDLKALRQFLLERFREGPFRLREIKPSDISDFVLRHGPSMAVGTARSMTTAFRSFLRWLFQKGELKADLAVSVPTVADWRLSTVPKHLAPEEVERVLKACDRRTAIGRRDYAILLLLARLGLRAGEVVALQLEDINWRVGEILIRGKGMLLDRMPLPADAGEALASYLRRDRPPCQT